MFIPSRRLQPIPENSQCAFLHEVVPGRQPDQAGPGVDAVLTRTKRSVLPLVPTLAQALSTAGATVAGFSGNARLTYQTDPYNYRTVAIVAAGVAVVGGFSATILASRLGVPRIHLADAWVFSLLAGASGALLQSGLDASQHTALPRALGAAGLAAAVGFQCVTMGRLAGLAQARFGNMPLGMPRGVAKVVYTGLAVGLGGIGTTVGLVARAHGMEPLRVAAFVSAGLGALPAIGALMAFCSTPVEPLTLAPHNGSDAPDGDLLA